MDKLCRVREAIGQSASAEANSRYGFESDGYCKKLRIRSTGRSDAESSEEDGSLDASSDNESQCDSVSGDRSDAETSEGDGSLDASSDNESQCDSVSGDRSDAETGRDRPGESAEEDRSDSDCTRASGESDSSQESSTQYKTEEMTIVKLPDGRYRTTLYIVPAGCKGKNDPFDSDDDLFDDRYTVDQKPIQYSRSWGPFGNIIGYIAYKIGWRK